MCNCINSSRFETTCPCLLVFHAKAREVQHRIHFRTIQNHSKQSIPNKTKHPLHFKKIPLRCGGCGRALCTCGALDGSCNEHDQTCDTDDDSEWDDLFRQASDQTSTTQRTSLRRYMSSSRPRIRRQNRRSSRSRSLASRVLGSRPSSTCVI